jgi:hypothetical protein
MRTDFNYGSPIGNGVSFHVGGFFRQGHGPRTTGYTANYGGQMKANLTKRFNAGHARVYYKYLNDRAAAYLPMPMQVSGTNDSPTWESAPNFSAQYGTPHSPYLLQNLGLGPDGQLRRARMWPTVCTRFPTLSEASSLSTSATAGKSKTARVWRSTAGALFRRSRPNWDRQPACSRIKAHVCRQRPKLRRRPRNADPHV